MSTDTTVSPLRQRMIEDMAARKLGTSRVPRPHSAPPACAAQLWRSRISSATVMSKTCFQHEARGPSMRFAEDTLDNEPSALFALGPRVGSRYALTARG